MGVDGVTVDVASARRAWRDGGHGEFWVEPRTTDTTYEALANAIEAANTASESSSGVHAQQEARSPKGFVALLTAFEEPSLEPWRDGVAERFTKQGFVSVLGGTGAARFPRWVDSPSSTALEDRSA